MFDSVGRRRDQSTGRLVVIGSNTLNGYAIRIARNNAIEHKNKKTRVWVGAVFKQLEIAYYSSHCGEPNVFILELP